MTRAAAIDPDTGLDEYGNPPSKQHSWFNVTTWALHSWRQALEVYYTDLSAARNDPQKIANAQAWITHARAEYRRRVLSWYRKLLLPMKIGDCVPNEVALLLAEAWGAGEKLE